LPRRNGDNINFGRKWATLQKVLVYPTLVIVAVVSIFPDFLTWIVYVLPFVGGENYFIRLLIAFFALAFFFLCLDFNWYIKNSTKNFANISEYIKSHDFIKCDSLEYGINLVIAYALERDKKITSIHIFARTSKTYYEKVKHRSERITFCDVALDRDLQQRLGFKDISQLHFNKVRSLKVLATKNEILTHQNLEKHENRWANLKKGGDGDRDLFEDVNIRTCNLFPANHYAIINDKYVVDGSYKSIMHNSTQDAEDTLLETFVYLNRNLNDLVILESRKKHFDSNFEEAANN